MLGQSAVIAFANAAATAILALILIFTFEIVLNVSTNMSLMVLCDYNHPLLERLKREAPGTFFHSLMVATLVEDEKRLGDTVIDMGGGTTTIAVFGDGHLLHTAQIPVGGWNVTNDLARGLSTPLVHAERLKALLMGHGTAAERDAVALNAGALLMTAGLADSLKHGVELAKGTLASGAPHRVLTAFVEATRA